LGGKSCFELSPSDGDFEVYGEGFGADWWDDETGFGFLNTLAAVDLAKKTWRKFISQLRG
jgi:hypothetical protein